MPHLHKATPTAGHAHCSQATPLHKPKPTICPAHCSRATPPKRPHPLQAPPTVLCPHSLQAPPTSPRPRPFTRPRPLQCRAHKQAPPTAHLDVILTGALPLVHLWGEHDVWGRRTPNRGQEDPTCVIWGRRILCMVRITHVWVSRTHLRSWRTQSMVRRTHL